MSRNLRHKSTSAPAEKSVRRNSTNIDNSSGDDAYEGVDLISDSEEDEPDVEEVEEQAIIESENDYDEDSTPRPTIDDGQDWEGFAFEDAVETTTQRGAASSNGERRVHFDLSGDDSDSTASFDNFPDFIDKASLDPIFRQQIDQDDGDDSLSDTYWELENDDGGVPIGQISLETEDDSDNSSGSGYETDEGETTEEDEEPARMKTITPARSFIQPIPGTSDSSDEDTQVTPLRRGPGRARGGKPRLGTWSHSSNKPYAMISGSGKTRRMVMFNLKDGKYPSFGSGSRPQDLTQGSPIIESSPMISNSGNVMMSAMFDQSFPGFGGQAVGPLEAFYPFTTVNADGTIIHDSSSGYDQSDMDDEENLDMNDFFDFGEGGGSDDEEEEEQASDSPDTLEPSSTPARPTTARSEDQVHPLLAHFGNHPVTAFRNHQNRHYQMNHNGLSQESLAFGNTIRGVKTGRLQHASIPLTPQRKQKNKTFIPDSSPLAAHQQLGRKRGLDGEEVLETRGHKRNRSSM